MALDHVDLQTVVNPKDTSPEKAPPPIYGEPEDLANQFFWEKENVMNYQKVEAQLNEFSTNNPELKIDTQKVLLSLAEANKSAEEDFNILYSNQSNKPDYHNAEHVMLTATVGLKIFLGGVAELYKDPKFKVFIDTNPGKLQQLIDVAVMTMTRHELDDWWSRRSEKSIKILPQDPEWDKNQDQVRKNTSELCQKLGITEEDFNRMNIIDTFFVPLESDNTKIPPVVGSLDRALNQSPMDNPYFKDTNGQPNFEFLGNDPQIQRMFLKLLGQATRSADFLQLYNPNYYREARIVTKDTPQDGLASNLGSIALAKEFYEFRPNAAKPLGWIKEGGGINWENVGVGKNYLERFALPNIKLGISYLKNFNLQEGTNVEVITSDIESALRSKN